MALWVKEDIARHLFRTISAEISEYSWAEVGISCWVTVIRLVQNLEFKEGHAVIIGAAPELSKNLPPHVPNYTILNSLDGVIVISHGSWSTLTIECFSGILVHSTWVPGK